MNTLKEQKKIKLRFLALYGISLVLIFILVSAFWQKKSSATADVLQAAETETYFIQFDTLLHSRLDELDNMYTLFLKASADNTAEANGFLSIKNSMTTTLDSIAQQAAILASGSKKAAMEMVVNRYKNSLEIRDRLTTQLGSMPRNKSLPQLPENSIDSSASNTDTERLKNMVAGRDQEITRLEQKAQADLKEKNDLIASLQNQLRQRSPGVISNNPSASDGEWRQKYSSLKASYDKVAESEKALKSAYKIVAEDNRRLLGQLQSMKKG